MSNRASTRASGFVLAQRAGFTNNGNPRFKVNFCHEGASSPALMIQGMTQPNGSGFEALRSGESFRAVVEYHSTPSGRTIFTSIQRTGA